MKRLAIAMLGLIMVVSVLLFYPFYSFLQISNVRDGKILFQTKIGKDEEFVLSYIHSVNRRPVYDTIRNKGTQFIIVKSRFDSLGGGMPEVSADGSPIMLGRDGCFECLINRPTKEITFFLGWIANHTLHLKNQIIILSELTPPGTLLSIRVKKASYFEIMTGRF